MTEAPTVPDLSRMRKKIEEQIQKLEQDIFWLKNRVRVIDLAIQDVEEKEQLEALPDSAFEFPPCGW
jgi:prefoldin subunit 5